MVGPGGQQLLRVRQNHVRIVDPNVDFRHVPGHVRVIAPATEPYVPPWVVDKVRQHEAAFAANGLLPLLDINVEEPGIVRVQGLWTHNDRVIVITDTLLGFVTPELREPISIVGVGRDTKLVYTGPIDTALFQA
jgi:hypothetical protein